MTRNCKAEWEPRGNVQTVTIQSILKGAREAIIDFDGAAYRLRITRNHRLILTK
jgi:hemin uptake protein HemP